MCQTYTAAKFRPLAGAPPAAASLALQPAADCVLLSDRAKNWLCPDDTSEEFFDSDDIIGEPMMDK